MRTPFISRMLPLLACGIWIGWPAGLAAQAVQMQPLEIASPEAATVDAAGHVLAEIMAIPIKSIPRSLMAEAQGLAIVPGLIKGSFIVGVRHGRGVVVVRDETGTWRAPVFISMTGGSVGWQAGIQATDIILVFVTKNGVRGLLRGKFTIGADAAVAAGPVGREATLATDTSLRAEIYSYSRSRGLFLGVALDGTALQVDANATNRYYASWAGVAAAGQAGQTPPIPPSAVRLMETIARYTPVQNAGAGASGAVAAGPGANDAKAVRSQLVGSAQRLDAILDEAWRRYLALPAELRTADRQPTAEVLQASMARFNTVATSPTYRALAQRPEFQDTYRLLQRFVALQTPSARLPLPQPPR